MNSGWFAHVRSALELLYFHSGIAIAVAAVKALGQIKLTKDIAEKNARRESLKFAAERCQYYAHTCVALHTTLFDLLKKQGPLPQPVAFEVAAGEITVKNQQALGIVAAQFGKASMEGTYYLNSLEAFAIPFVAGVADDELGFQETADAFCKAIKELIVPIVAMRRQGAKYESCVRLYEVWSARLEAEKMKEQMKDLQKKIEKTPNTKIRPV